LFDRQLKVPGSLTTGVEAGDDMIVPPSSQHGAADQPQGSQAGAPQAGAPQAGAPHGAAIGGAAVRPNMPPPHGWRNSMNDGRRQGLLKPPKQLVQPGAARRLPSTIERHMKRDMVTVSTAQAA
jgi:hypothetical protein